MNDVAYRPSDTAPAPRRASETGSVGAHLGPQTTLVDLLDRLLGGGVVIQGQITLSLADIDLVDLDLRIVVASIDKLAGR